LTSGRKGVKVTPVFLLSVAPIERAGLMDIRLGGHRLKYDFEALNGRVLDMTWPYYGRMDRRGRIAAGIVFAVLLHLILLWVLLAERPHAWDMSHTWETEEPPLPVDLWAPTQPETQQEPMERPVTRTVTPHETPRSQPQPQPQPQPQHQSQAQVQPQPAVQAAPTQPVEVPQAKPDVIIPAPVPDTKPLPGSQAVKSFDEPRDVPMSLSTKKKEKDDIQKQDLAVGQASSLNLHQVPADAPVLSPVEPSGLIPAKPGGAQAGGATAGGGRTGAVALPGGGMSGIGLNGRGAVSQALQNHDYCADRQIKGQPIPKDCHMPDLASAKPLGPRPVASFDAELARRKAMAQPGNADYWRRVNQGIADPAHDDHRPRPGEYQNGKAARVMGECSQTDSCPTDTGAGK